MGSVEVPGSLESQPSVKNPAHTAVSNTEISSRLQKDIKVLQLSKEIEKSIYAVLRHSEYPQWMSVSGTLERNPVWRTIAHRTRRKMIKDNNLAGDSAPRVMHLDLFLVRCNDAQKKGHIYTYFSSAWKTNLFHFRQKIKRETTKHRLELNAHHLATHWSIPDEAVLVTPLPGEYAISVKPHATYHDLKIYVFEFCTVEVSRLPNSIALEHVNNNQAGSDQGAWFTLRTLIQNQKAWSLNGDVLLANTNDSLSTLIPYQNCYQVQFSRRGSRS